MNTNPEPSLAILYIDDEPLLRRATAEYLNNFNMVTETAASGSEALSLIEKNHYDAIISDYQMPGMNGIELLKEIRGRNIDIPFILFTGKGREEVVIEAIENGADFYLQKGGRPAPQFKELTHKIRIAVQRRRDARALRESELRFRSLILNSSDIIRILDREGTIIFDSPSSSVILGYPEGSLVGSKAFDYVHPDDRERVISDFLDVVNRCNSHTPTEYRIQKADGTYLYFESIGLNLIGVPGINGIVITTHSIQNQKMAELEIRKITDDLSTAYTELESSEKELRENYRLLAQREEALAKSEEQFRSMAERSSDLILIFDTQVGVTYASPSARPILGYYPEELMGRRKEFAADKIFPENQDRFMDGIRRTLAGEMIEDLEIKAVKKDGTATYLSLNAVPTYYEGFLNGVQFSIRDITRAKTTEIALRESESKFKALVEYSLDGTFILDPVGNIRFASSAAASIVGAESPEEIIGKKNVTEFVAIESLNDVNTDFLTVAGGVDGYIAQYKLQTMKNEERWIESIGKRIFFGGDQSILISIRDVTARKHAEDILQKVSSEMEQIIRNMSSSFAIWESVFDEYGRFVSFRFGYFNDAFAHATGLSYPDVKGKDVFEVWPGTEQAWIDTFGDVAITGNPREFEMYHSPTSNWYHCHAYRPTSSQDQVCIIADDVTERRAANSAFEASIRSMVGTTGINALKRITANISSWLKADCVMIGEIQEDKQTVKTLSMIFDGEEISNHSYSLRGTPCDDVKEKGFCIFYDNVAILFPKSRDLIDHHIRGYIGTPLRNSAGEVIGVLCALFREPIDPSYPVQETIDLIAVKAAAEIERAQIEQSLHKNQQMLSEAMDMAQLARWEYDAKTGFFTFDDRFYALYGTNTEREGGYLMTPEQYMNEFVHPGDYGIIDEEVKKTLSTTDPDYVGHLEHRIIRRDGEIRYITVRTAITKDAEGKTVKTHGVNQDITERKRSEEKIQVANRQLNLLSSITRHDILNSVSLCHIYLDTALTACKEPEISSNLEKIQLAIEEIQSQIEFTRVYQDLGSHEPHWYLLDSVMPRSPLPDTVLLTTDLENISIFSDPMLNSVLSNLLDNSIRHGKTVTEIRVSARESGDKLTIVWEDNGVGISRNDKEKIFERGYGKNTGIGLFLIREILSLTSITIQETGEEGKGARFEITVPKGAFRREDPRIKRTGI